MSVIRRNIIANLLGSVWIAVMTLVITPVQVNLLGIEAYGLLGFISTLQLLFTGFDFGLSSTLTRELAADHSPDRMGSVELVGTATTVYWVIALAVGIVLIMLSGVIARTWFHSKELNPVLLAHALRVIAVYLALRWPVALYIGILSGLQRMEILNVTKVSTASLRLVGGICVLVLWPDLRIFLWWTAFNALVEVATYALVCRAAYPAMQWRPGLSLRAVKAVWRYSMTMNALAILAVVVVQLDRLMVSKMLPLDALGYYSLAYSAAAGIIVIITAIGSAALPSFAATHSSRHGPVTLLDKYDAVDRAVLFTAGAASFTLMFFGRPLLSLWVNPSAAGAAWGPLAVLASGFWLSAAISGAYNLAVATGNPNWPLRITAVCTLPYAACLYALIRLFGALGAAVAWLAWNATNLLLLVPIVHRNLFGTSSIVWFRRTLLPFLILGCASFTVPTVIAHSLWLTPARGVQFASLAAALLIYVVFGYFLLGRTIRADVRLLIRAVMRTLNGRIA